MSMKKTRMSASVRRKAILEKVAPLFARFGPDSITTRQLAETAEISEALLFRHFSNKQTLYTAATRHQIEENRPDDLTPGDTPPSTHRLVVTTCRLAQYLTSSSAEDIVRQTCRSLLTGDNQTKNYLAPFASRLIPSLKADLAAARSSGDCISGEVFDVELWLAQHLLFSLHLFTLPESPPIEYNCPRFELLKRTIAFALRGLGLKQSAIDREFAREVL